MEEKETIAEICERLRKTGDCANCMEVAEAWGFSCDGFTSCGECGEKVYNSIADRIEAAHQREVAEAYDPQRVGGRFDVGSFDYAIECLREFRWQHATNDRDAIPYINAVARAHEREMARRCGKSPDDIAPRYNMQTRETYTGLTVKMGKPAEASDYEDTRERVEGSLAHLIVGICAARLRTDKTNMELVARFKDEFIRILDRQEAITERNCRAEYEDMRDYLQKQVDGLRGEVEHLNKALEAYRLANEALREQNMELRRTLDDLHERYANADAVNGLVEHANDCLKIEADRQRDALERCRLAYETVRGLFDGWDGE